MEIALGCHEDHLVVVDGKTALHSEVVEPWKQLVEAARIAGFELALASGYRSFDRQRLIWNAKLSGQRPVLDDQGCQLDLSCLSSLESIQRVMRWSALPGASRHHWGTDMDIYDKGAVSEDYQLQLVPSEYSGDGPFVPMTEWLHCYLKDDSAPAFFFPYQQDHGGIAPEPWHLSYRPVAERFQYLWSLSSLACLIEQSDLAEKEAVLGHLEPLYTRFILRSLNPEYSV
jgi:LAS superfamily LD-carboxypeptidase LdcB